MSTAIANPHPRVANYLLRLDAALATMPHADAKEILREIQAHISDSLAGRCDDDAIARVLERLGTPEALAQSYATETMLTRASRSFSPWMLLRTTWCWAKTGTRGFAVFLVGFIGYSLGLALTMTLLLKPIMPARVGLWVGPGTFDFGIGPQGPGVHEVLGTAYIPVTTVLAFAAVWGTTYALRWLIRKRKPFAAC